MTDRLIETAPRRLFRMCMIGPTLPHSKIVLKAMNLTLTKPPYLAVGGLLITFANLLIGDTIQQIFGLNAVTRAVLSALIVVTVVTPPICLVILLAHYKDSSASISKLIALYLSLIAICATINLDLMLHFSYSGAPPFHGVQSIWPAGMSQEPLPPFPWSNVLLAFVDCLHFSVASLSTVGYGDIYPTVWYAKLAVDVQILMGLGITVLAVGHHFSSRE